MELLLETAINWWDRHDKLNEDRLECWYLSLLKKYPPISLSTRNELIRIGAKDVAFFYKDGLFIKNVKEAFESDIKEYKVIFKRYRKHMDRINRDQISILEYMKSSHGSDPTAKQLNQTLNVLGLQNNAFLSDIFNGSKHEFSGFGALLLTEKNIYNKTWFIEKIDVKPQPSVVIAIRKILRANDLIELVTVLSDFEKEIEGYLTTLVGGIEFSDMPGKFVRYSHVNYTRHNGHFFNLLKNMIRRQRLVLIRFLKSSIDRDIKVDDPLL